MMNKDAGLWLYLWNGDIEQLTLFFRGLHEMGCNSPGTVIMPEGVQPPKGFTWTTRGWGFGLPPEGSRQEWVGLIWPGCVPQAPSWDLVMLQELQPWAIVTSAECGDGDWRRGPVLFSSAALGAVGGFTTDKITEEQIQTWARAAADSRNWLRSAAQVGRRTPLDPPPAPDMVAVMRMVRHLAATREAMGTFVIEPDYTGVRLQIATPTIDGRPESAYSDSLAATERYMRDKGVYLEYLFERWNADICLARSNIISKFLTSTCTHLLMIDSDMGWKPTALDRLIYANKPLVAVAGPKKSYPLRFAASHVTADGQPAPLTMDGATACAEVTSVGAAFMMIRKDCVEAMVKGYPELRYTGADGHEAWALFLPVVEKGGYYAEDFSFCKRWRDLGEKVYICPDVPLQHVGAHVYEGDLLSNARKVG